MTDAGVCLQDTLNSRSKPSHLLRGQRENTCNYCKDANNPATLQSLEMDLLSRQTLKFCLCEYSCLPRTETWEIFHSFYVGEVALRETKHTSRIHSGSPARLHFHPHHEFLAQLCTKSKHLFCLFGRPVMMSSSRSLTFGLSPDVARW